MTDSANAIQGNTEMDLAAQSLRKSIQSNINNVEDKLVLENLINNLSQEAYTMIDILYHLPEPCQKEILLGYKRLLQCNIDSVNKIIANLLFR